jgi:hypothetical protein
VMRLLRANGLSVALVEADFDAQYPERQVFRLKRGDVCPDCGGRGKYVGITVKTAAAYRDSIKHKLVIRFPCRSLRECRPRAVSGPQVCQRRSLGPQKCSTSF